MKTNNHASIIARLVGIHIEQTESAIALFDEGNTIPFVARYRKEVTGNLDEEQLRQISTELARLRALDERRVTIITSIEEQGKMTDEIRSQLDLAMTMTVLEDLYQPFKPKRRTRASIAKEKGLQGLADQILNQAISKQLPEMIAESYLSDQVATVQDSLEGARDIAAEVISDHPEVRKLIREKALTFGTLSSERIASAEDLKRVYENYYDFNFRVSNLKPYQVLALNRGEREKVLRVKVILPEHEWQEVILKYFRPDKRSGFYEQLLIAINDAVERLLLPAIERDVRRILTEKADSHAIHVFASNLRALLSQPPLVGHVVMGIDPGFRTGCKVAVVNATGRLLTSTTIYPHEPYNKWEETLAILSRIAVEYHVTLVSIGNGTASRETEQLVVQLIDRLSGDLKYIITNEAGASVYSASPLARAELPGLDVSMRGAVSIARRIQDPLAELVKIDPKSIGVGLYQHDVEQAMLTESLNSVVESVVNQVGVDINTASPALLTYVSGIGPKLSEKIVAYRDEKGPFRNRHQFIQVAGLGQKAFEQSAGFLRIRDGENMLDSSAIHPESYSVAQAIIRLAGIQPETQVNDRQLLIDKLIEDIPVDILAVELGIGLLTLKDILEQLVRPGRDPRSELPLPILRTDVMKMEDLVSGMRLKGTVRNVVDFGVFVDIGVKQDGLLHKSQFSSGVKMNVGDVIEVVIISVDQERGRISLKLSG